MKTYRDLDVQQKIMNSLFAEFAKENTIDDLTELALIEWYYRWLSDKYNITVWHDIPGEILTLLKLKFY